MSDDRFRRIEAILDEALERPEAERAEYLAEACGDDPELRAEVESLLAASEGASDWFDRLGEGLAEGRLDEIDAALGGDRRIGAWRTLERIGGGGMGSVWLAERADGQFEQRVAIKVIRRGLESPDAVRRFLVEREILARLEHPNVARLVDGGVTDDGVPWFAMELVDGEPIDRWCDARDLTVEERLGLFLQVAEAVAYLHRNLVVHRDLKPGNVLVGDDGRGRVVDFGIAKMLDEEGADLTRTGAHPRTPRYAAPEQVEGGSITTATDVYALGVLLYELLAGGPIFHTEGHTLERSILETDPAPPSEAAPPERRRRLRGDLDTIVLTAIRKRPERRYGSVDALAEDVRRHLEGRPVAARPDRVAYRVGKFVRRHAWGVSTAAAMVAIVLAFGVFASVQSTRATRERDKAEQVSALLSDLFSAADPSQARGEELTARELVDLGAERIRTELADQPLVRADLLAVLGRTYWSLGLYDRARDLYQEGLESRRTTLGEDHPDLATSHYDLGRTLLELADFEGAREHLEEAVRIRRRALGEVPSTAFALTELARVYEQAGEFDRAEPLHEEAVRIHRESGDSVSLETTLDNYAIFLSTRGRPADAVPLYRKALSLGRAVHGPDHPGVLRIMNNLATAYLRLGDLEEAESLYRETLEIERRVHGARHPDVSTPLANLGNLLLRYEGREDEAEAAHREALAIDLEHYGEDHPLVAQRTHQLGLSLDARGRHEEAQAHFRRALESLERSLPERHVNLAFPMVALGRSLVDQGRAVEAVPILREALDLRVEGFPPGHARIAQAESELGGALIATGQFEEAGVLLARALVVLDNDSEMSENLVEETRRNLETARRGLGATSSTGP